MATDSSDIIDILTGGNEAAKTADSPDTYTDILPPPPPSPQFALNANGDNKRLGKEADMIWRMSSLSVMLLLLMFAILGGGIFLLRNIGREAYIQIVEITNVQIIEMTAVGCLLAFMLYTISQSLVSIAESIHKRVLPIVKRSLYSKRESWTPKFAEGLCRWGGVILAISSVGGCCYDVGHINGDDDLAMFCAISTMVWLFFAWIIERLGDLFKCLSWCEVAVQHIGANNASDGLVELEQMAGKAESVHADQFAPDKFKKAQTFAKGIADAISAGRFKDAISECKNATDSYRDAAASSCVKNAIHDVGLSMVPIPAMTFAISKFPVNVELWHAVMDNIPYFGDDAGLPKVNVSWNDCQLFLEKLNAFPEVKASSIIYRLPSAKEWEFACHAGAKGSYCKLSDGTEISKDTLGDVAWYGANSNGRTHLVCQKKPNAFGIYDMHGNVYEWTATTVGDGKSTMGGSWRSSATCCASNFSSSCIDILKRDDLGFRLAADIVK